MLGKETPGDEGTSQVSVEREREEREEREGREGGEGGEGGKRRRGPTTVFFNFIYCRYNTTHFQQ